MTAPTNMGAVGLYVHIPFCVRKCLYCDFLSAPSGEETKKAYTEALIREIKAAGREESRPVDSIFFGGGTPSILPVGELQSLLSAIYSSFTLTEDCEISMEVNPGTVTEDFTQLLRAGLNRISIGLQSSDDRELAALGRIHSFETFLHTYDLLRSAGAANINIDLMAAIPGQTEASFLRTLARVAALKSEHISVYSLIIEEGTPFFAMYGGDMEKEALPLPDEETERAMYARTLEVLSKEGFDRYEISNYARPGCACRHNLRYWERGDYLGLGIGAASLMRGKRWNNTASLSDYIRDAGMRSVRVDEQVLTDREAMEEFMFLGLRKCAGIRREDFSAMFSRTPEQVYGEVLLRHIREGLLYETGEGYALTPRGIDISNSVLADYLFDD